MRRPGDLLTHDPWKREPEFLSDRSRNVPFWEELIPTPPFFGKSAQAIDGKEIGVKREVYGKWKSAEGTEGKGDRGGREKKERDRADERRGTSRGREGRVAWRIMLDITTEE